MSEQEGVIKFHLEHRQEVLPADVDIAGLEQARNQLLALGLVGQDSSRYQGLGFGNLSQRYVPVHSTKDVGSGMFVITGSQTGHLSSLSRRDYALVTAADLGSNRLISTGETRPSSESTTHALLYQLSRHIGAVIHVHSPDIWKKAESLGLLTTPSNAPYGSPELVSAVTSLWCERDLQTAGLFVMLGHQDGVMSFGPDIETALGRIKTTLTVAIN